MRPEACLCGFNHDRHLLSLRLGLSRNLPHGAMILRKSRPCAGGIPGAVCGNKNGETP
ncbi:hypothetical protein Ga0080574_TMP3058 [Salipiger abyssi]|uniref:Uncharacterized protein n=1 Tax=Salipiger abyssi TaxID=1250539 RepID=A0A1P8UVH8_9RHOB|nr:hypothetical protein Ga0080574_TMP3058 [Salipiger abyssi]